MGLFAPAARAHLPQAAACALAAFLFNLPFSRVEGRASVRRTPRAFPLGILRTRLGAADPAFPHRPDIGGRRAMLAFGDGAATLVGRAVKRPLLPWNAEKTLAGTAAFVLVGGTTGVLLAWWTRSAVTPATPWQFVVFGPLLAALAASLVESMPVRLDDNLSVPIAAAAVLWGASLVTREAWHASAPVLAWMLPPAVAFNAVVAALGWRAGTVAGAGAVGGAAIGTIIPARTGLRLGAVVRVLPGRAVSSRMGL
jgi:hypothetical protein